MGSSVGFARPSAMAFCPSCGSPAATDASFCAKCGRSLAGTPSGAAPLGAPAAIAHAPAAPYSAPPAHAYRPGAPERPIGVTIVGIVLLVGSLFVAFGAIVLFLGSQWLASFIPVAEARSIFTVFGPILALFVLLLAGLVAATGWGALQGHNWAWVLVLALMGLNALGGLSELASQDFEGVITLLVSGIVIWYFFRPEVREWFDQRGRA